MYPRLPVCCRKLRRRLQHLLRRREECCHFFCAFSFSSPFLAFLRCVLQLLLRRLRLAPDQPHFPFFSFSSSSSSSCLVPSSSCPSCPSCPSSSHHFSYAAVPSYSSCVSASSFWEVRRTKLFKIICSMHANQMQCMWKSGIFLSILNAQSHASEHTSTQKRTSKNLMSILQQNFPQQEPHRTQLLQNTTTSHAYLRSDPDELVDCCSFSSLLLEISQN